jgi:hypothetical protein
MKKNVSLFSLSLVLVLLATGCKTITVSCLPEAPAIDNQQVTNFGEIGEHGIGFFNLNGSALGDVYELKLTPNKEVFANPDRSITYTENSSDDFVKRTAGTTPIDVAISWEFDAKAQSQLDSSQQAAIQASSTKTWSLDLENASQISLKSTLDQINTDDRNKDLKAHILSNPTSIFMVLNPALVGDSSELKVDQKSQAQASNSIKLGWMITANVNYSCTADLLRKKVGTDQPTLITYPELVKASADGTSVVHSAGLSFPAPMYAQAVSVGVDTRRARPSKAPSYATILFCKNSGNDKKDYGCTNH